MEPFSPQDPIRKLLDQAREVEVRPNFTQNVVRLARQTPQDRGWLAGLRAWWQENTMLGGLSVAGTAVAALMMAFVILQPEPAAVIVEVPVIMDELPLLPETEAAWESPLQTEALLAVEDSSQFTDSEISFLLY
jgi:hypothetical protein